MNMTEKNGQPSMEEILASIRRIIAEEPANQPSHGDLRGAPIMLKGDGVLDDAGDFDLPAIFRASPLPAAERPTPLLGRLTDAIRSATAAQPEGGPYLNGHDSHREPADVGRPGAEAPAAYPGLSTLKPVRHDGPAPSESMPINGRPVNGHVPFAEGPAHPSAPESEPPAAMASAGSGDEPKRVMAPFKDTHFLRMSGPAPEPAPAQDAAPPAPVAPPQAAPVEPVVSLIPAPVHTHIPPVEVSVPPFGASEPSEPPLAAAPAGPQVVSMPPPPLPPAPLVDAGAEGVGSIEDTTADLLRPMLRQWLADNMPRMVEKALHIEIAESVKTPKKP